MVAKLTSAVQLSCCSLWGWERSQWIFKKSYHNLLICTTCTCMYMCRTFTTFTLYIHVHVHVAGIDSRGMCVYVVCSPVVWEEIAVGSFEVCQANWTQGGPCQTELYIANGRRTKECLLHIQHTSIANNCMYMYIALTITILWVYYRHVHLCLSIASS